MLQNSPSGYNTSTFIKLPFVIKISDLSIFEWPFYTGFTVLLVLACDRNDLFILLWSNECM